MLEEETNKLKTLQQVQHTVQCRYKYEDRPEEQMERFGLVINVNAISK